MAVFRSALLFYEYSDKKGRISTQYGEINGRCVSKVGIGGHYSKMEEGLFEERYAQVNRDEVQKRTVMMEKAFEAGITYFDTTWRNEVDMLSEAIKPLGIRDRIHINGMVLGAFAGSKATGMTPAAYVDKWLAERLRSLPGNHFDSFMINAIDENYSEEACAELLEHLEKRRDAGDFDTIGFSCHDHQLAREIADTFPQFSLIMLAYNYKNRRFEETFAGYNGKAAFVAMKPLIWYEYGIPFCKINALPSAARILGQDPDPQIAAKAVRWNLKNPLITTCVCGVNSLEELDTLILAGSGDLTEKEEQELWNYRHGIESENRLPFFIASCLSGEENRRSFQFGLMSLAKALGYPAPEIPLNREDSDRRLLELREVLMRELDKKGLGYYLK